MRPTNDSFAASVVSRGWSDATASPRSGSLRFKTIAFMLPACLLVSTAVADDAGVALPDLTVSAGRVEQVQGQTIAPISVIDREALDQRQARSLDDVLQDIPGVTASSGPRRDALQPTLRGLSDGRVVVRIDGARQNLQINHRGQTFFDPALLQRVEVLRGPASTLYGSGAIGGVVDLRTLDADALLASGAVHGGRVFSGYQSNADERVLGATLATRQRGFGLLGSLSMAQANDYEDGNGERIAFSGSDSESALLKATWAAGEASNFSATYFSFDDESLSRVTADRPRGDVIQRDIQQRTGSLRYTFQPLGSALWDLEVGAYRTTVDMDERPQDTTQPTIVNELQTTGLDLFNTSRAVTGPVAHQLTYGIELYRDEQVGLENGQPRPQFENAEQAVMGAFIQDRIALIERAALTVGARVDRIELSAERQGLESIRHTEVSPQATLSVVLTDQLDAYLSYAEAFRAPSLRELYVGGQHFPGNTYVPNPDLDPERAHNIEAGLLWSRSGVWNTADRLHGQLSIYRNDIDDFIEQIVRGDGDPAMPNTTRFENVTEARLEGIEIELRYDHPRYRAALIGSRIRGDDRTQGDPLASIPADEIMLVAAWRAVDGLEVGARGRHAATQGRLPLTTDPDAAGPAAAHSVADLFASWRLGSALRLDARIDNLFDRQYRRAVNLVPNPGRNLRLQIGYDF